MAVIVSEELELANNFKTFDQLKDDIESANSMNGVIDAFVENSSTLKGETWDSVKSKMTLYKSALSNIANVSNILSEAISKALKELMDFISPYESLDTADIPKIQNEIKLSNTNIDNIIAEMNSTIPIEVEGKDGKKTTASVSLSESNPSRYNSLKADLTAARELLDNLTKQLDKLNQLEAKYTKVKADLDEAFASVEGMNANISQIVPTQEYIYQPKFN